MEENTFYEQLLELMDIRVDGVKKTAIKIFFININTYKDQLESLINTNFKKLKPRAVDNVYGFLLQNIVEIMSKRF
jgi:hypothetical protein